MKCVPIELEMPDGYKRNVDLCRDVDLPRNIKGATNKKDTILISKYLDDLYDLGISEPETYVYIHEANHILHPEMSEYQIRKKSDMDYRAITGEEIDTAGYFRFAEHVKKMEAVKSYLFD